MELPVFIAKIPGDTKRHFYTRKRKSYLPMMSSLVMGCKQTFLDMVSLLFGKLSPLLTMASSRWQLKLVPQHMNSAFSQLLHQSLFLLSILSLKISLSFVRLSSHLVPNFDGWSSQCHSRQKCHHLSQRWTHFCWSDIFLL